MNQRSTTKLTAKKLRYAQLRAEAMLPKFKCYAEATGVKESSAKSQYLYFERCPAVQAEIKRLQKETETKLVLSWQEKREFLARVVRAKVSELPEDSDLIESIQRHYDRNGNEVRVTIKLPLKSACIDLDNKMAGHNGPEEINVTLEGGVMVVPAFGATLADWEKEAIAQQDGLKKKASSPLEEGDSADMLG